MINTIFGTKHNLTQVWDVSGKRLPITKIKVDPLTVTQIKTTATDGYQAAQFGMGTKKWTKITHPLQGHLKVSYPAATPTQAARFLREIRISGDTELKAGDKITSSQVLEPGDIVNATGVSQGKGFAGTVVRWGFHGGPRTHGQSDRERAPGSIGQTTTPGRVYKGKKMAGHLGNAQVTVRNLMVVKVDEENGEIWIKGQVPGGRNTLITITKIGHQNFPGLFDPNAPAPTPASTKEPALDTPPPSPDQDTASTNTPQPPQLP